MAFEIPEQVYSGKIGEVILGSGKAKVSLGGEDSYPFHLFEGQMPNTPKIAMEIWDYDPSEEWPAAAVEPFKDVISSPETWAKKCVEQYGADIIVVQLKSTDPNGMDRGPEEAAEVVKKVVDAVDVPVLLWGTANNEKDEAVFKHISESFQGKNLALSPIEEPNHKGVGASALGYGHTVVASSPIDVNLAKQLNILLNNLGVSLNNIVIDPTTGGLGYGLEYSYSVMERITMAALTQEDDKLQLPMVNNIGNEVWKCKEAGLPLDEDPTLGDPEKRGVLMEVVSAVSFLLAGSDVLILRHPETVRLVRAYINLMTEGGMASELEPISKFLKAREPDLLSISPEPNLEIEKPEEKPPKVEKKAAPEAKKKPEEEEAKKKAEEEAKKEAEEEARKEAEARAKEKAKAEEEAKKKTEEEAKAKAEEEAKKKEEEAKAEAEEEAKKKAEEEAKKKAEEEEAKKKAEEEAKKKAEAKAKEREELLALRYKRAQEREKHLAEMEKKKVKKTAAKVQLDMVDKLIQNIDRIHRRI